jgi:Flp pilus assembly protein TadD
LGRIACSATVLAAAGCGAARGAARPPDPPTSTVDVRGQSAADSLQTFIGKVRTLSAEARPPRTSVQTVEASDRALAAALLAAVVAPGGATHRAVADEYMRLGILDKAHEHLSAAVALDPQDAAAWDRMARLWRDGGLPHLGLGDAYRGLYFAPSSPVAHNTVGTVLQALGRHKEARAAYEQALQLDATAAYAVNNLCYSWLIEGNARAAVQACSRALLMQPNLEAARNNLALAYAISGNIDAAEQAFASGGERARAQYNLGVLHLARRRYTEAVKAFEIAQTSRPGFQAAETLARYARQQADRSSEP